MNRGKREKTANPKHDLATQRFYFLIGILALTLLFLIASVVVWAITPRPASKDGPAKSGGLFSVKSIVVEGNTKYHEEAVIGESGIEIGQNIFNVDSEKVEDRLIETFPYYENVEVQTLHMKEVKITVYETPVVGVVYANGFWVPVGKNGKALDETPIVSDRPKGRLYIKGTTLPEGGIVIGQPAINEEEAKVLDEIFSAMERYGLNGIVEIDVTDMADITMNWHNQISIRLGNASNLTHEIGVVSRTIPNILESRGQHITGVLNLISYSNDTLEDMAIFTPSSLLPESTTSPRKGETTTTDANVTTTTQSGANGNN